MVARERFELSSRAPEAPMLDRYTTGLQPMSSKHGFNVITLALHARASLPAPKETEP
jgi:hypothetical protein